MDLSTTYLGLDLRSPLVVGAAAPLTEDLGQIMRLEEAGAAAIVMHSLFEEQLEQEMLELHHHMQHGTESYAESLSYFPEPSIFHIGHERYLKHIQRVKELASIPVIASLNGSTPGGWIDFARQIEQAGADALELNLYAVPTELNLTSTEIEQQYLMVVRAVRRAVNIPVAVKLSPYFTNVANMANRLALEGANGLVLFNRFYQPDIDIDTLDVVPNLVLSTPHDMRLPLRWIAILYRRIGADLAATGGIQRGTDVVRMLMAGAKVTMIVSALLRHGPNHLHDIEQEMRHWMEEREYASVNELQGCMSQATCPNPTEFERAQYMKAIQTYQPHPESAFEALL